MRCTTSRQAPALQSCAENRPGGLFFLAGGACLALHYTYRLPLYQLQYLCGLQQAAENGFCDNALLCALSAWCHVRVRGQPAQRQRARVVRSQGTCMNRFLCDDGNIMREAWKGPAAHDVSTASRRRLERDGKDSVKSLRWAEIWRSQSGNGVNASPQVDKFRLRVPHVHWSAPERLTKSCQAPVAGGDGSNHPWLRKMKGQRWRHVPSSGDIAIDRTTPLP